MHAAAATHTTLNVPNRSVTIARLLSRFGLTAAFLIAVPACVQTLKGVPERSRLIRRQASQRGQPVAPPPETNAPTAVQRARAATGALPLRHRALRRAPRTAAPAAPIGVRRACSMSQPGRSGQPMPV